MKYRIDDRSIMGKAENAALKNDENKTVRSNESHGACSIKELVDNFFRKSSSTFCSPMVFRNSSFSSSCLLTVSGFLFGLSKRSAIPPIDLSFPLRNLVRMNSIFYGNFLNRWFFSKRLERNFCLEIFTEWLSFFSIVQITLFSLSAVYTLNSLLSLCCFSRRSIILM